MLWTTVKVGKKKLSVCKIMLPAKCRVCLSEALSAIISPLVWSCERAAKHRYILLAVNCCSIACRRGCSSQAASDCGWAMLPSGSVKISPWMTNGAAPSTELFFEIADFELVELGTAIAQLLSSISSQCTLIFRQQTWLQNKTSLTLLRAQSVFHWQQWMDPLWLSAPNTVRAAEDVAEPK